MKRFFHYTCDHGHAAISDEGFTKPFPQVVLGGIELTWFTDLDAPDRKGLGLTSVTLNCDRTAYRFEADITLGIRWWPHFARDFGLASRRRHLELADGALPMHWYVSEAPVPVLAATR